MIISIIDIGTQSLKHSIFEVEGTTKKTLHYKRYSDANLGESEVVTKEAIDRTLAILAECIETNKSFKVTKLQILGTEIVRKATNAQEFIGAVKKVSGHDIEVVSHDLEAQYLYDGFIDIIPPNFTFAAMNIGGGSTEVVIGNKNTLIHAEKIPFGVKFFRKNFLTDKGMDWKAVDAYLDEHITLSHSIENVFVTGVLNFISTVGPHLGFTFEDNTIPNHPLKCSMEEYVSYLGILRNTPIEVLRSYHPKDPTYADSFSIGQSVYVAIARKLGAVTIIPSNNDLTDGVIHQLVG